MPDIPRDAPLTDIFIRDPAGNRRRVYRGRTKAHIEWKLHEHRKSHPEVVEVLHDVGSGSFLEGVDTDEAEGEVDE